MNFNRKILIVDDEPHVRKFVSLLLKQLGEPTIIEAGCGEEAVSLYQKERPDMVLLDINMPNMNGLEALRQIRAVDPECVVVLLTSLATRQMVEETISLGAVYYIRKDTSKEEIIRLLKETISLCFETE